VPKYFGRIFFYRRRSKDRENATYFTILGDEIAAKKALARAAEISNELVRKLINVSLNVTYAYF
jgi:hypothetical protein